MKVLFVLDDIWHPAEVIERGLKTFDHEEMEFDLVRTAKDILTPEFIKSYDAMIIAKGNAINAANSAPWFEPTVTECGPKEIAEYVENGGGLVALHAGLCIGKGQVPAYTNLVGSYFLDHPLREMTHVHVVGDHPIVEGVQDFSERDEHYQIAVTEQSAEVFLVTSSEHGGVFPSGYAFERGAGRVVGLTPGHTLAVWSNPEFHKLLKNAIRWSVGAI